MKCRFLGIIIFVMLLIGLQSCSDEDMIPVAQEVFTCHLLMQSSCPSFDGDTRASHGVWEDGDVIYITTDTTDMQWRGKATYNAGSDCWTLLTDRQLSGTKSGICSVYYFKGTNIHINGVLPTEVSFDARTAIYSSHDATYVVVGENVYLRSQLKPYTWRMCFSGIAGSNVIVKASSNFNTFAGLNLSTGELISQRKDISLVVNSSTYTDYIYANFVKEESVLLVSVNDTLTTRKFDNNLLRKGQSGIFSLPSSSNENGWEHIEAVDLGLPSGLKWATCNVGATSPEDYGSYLAWGETEPKETYNWSTYKWCLGTNITLTKYCTYSQYGTVDNIAFLDLEDDVANVCWGGVWRMPTIEEFEELERNCYWGWTTRSGVKGYEITGSNNNAIFLPAAGYRGVDGQTNVDSIGYYWSASLYKSFCLDACYLYFGALGKNCTNHYDRSDGHSVRAVLAPCSSTNISVSSIEVLGNKNYMSVGETQTLSVSVLPVDATNKSVNWSSSNQSVATVSYSGLVTAVGKGPATITATATDGSGVKGTLEITITGSPLSEHEYVDLGLPSGLKWATCNLGATVPEEYGDYFAWGETIGYVNNHRFYWDSYGLCNGNANSLVKYCTDSSYGSVDNKKQLDLQDDAAYIKWGDGWRMPTIEELDELRSKCTWTWTTLNGINGYRVVGTNGNFIFLPAAGYHYENGKRDEGQFGDYWSSSLFDSYCINAQYLYFHSGNKGTDNYYRCIGYSIRPVRY